MVTPVAAEEFIIIGGGYECVRYANGNEFLITGHTPNGDPVTMSRDKAVALCEKF